MTEMRDGEYKTLQSSLTSRDPKSVALVKEVWSHLLSMMNHNPHGVNEIIAPDLLASSVITVYVNIKNSASTPL